MSDSRIPLSLEAKTTALVLIDLQQGITARHLAPHSASAVIEHGVRLANALRAAGGPVFFVRVKLSEMLPRSVDNPMRDPNAPPPPPSASELVTEIELHPGDRVITKRQWGAFYATELDQLLRRGGIKTIILGGIATNFGVESTARAAFDRGFHLVFAEDAMSSMHNDMHNFCVQQIFSRMGHVRSSDEIVAALG